MAVDGGRGDGSEAVGEVFWVFVGSGTRAGVAGAIGSSSVSASALSGGAWERADARRRVGVGAVPGPAGWEVQRPAACVAGQAAGNREQSAAQRAGGADGRVGQSEQLRSAQQVLCQCAEDRPGAVGVKLAGGEVRQRLVLEVGDDLLDDRVLAVLGLDDGELVGAVGDKREVAPVGPQLGLRAEQAAAADDQSRPA
jgi:hypothetical protein